MYRVRTTWHSHCSCLVGCGASLPRLSPCEQTQSLVGNTSTGFSTTRSTPGKPELCLRAKDSELRPGTDHIRVERTTMITSKRIRLLTLMFASLLMTSMARGQSSVTDDSYVQSGSSTTHGTETGLHVRTGPSSGSTAAQTAFLRFNLGTLPAGFSAASVQKATLKLFVN